MEYNFANNNSLTRTLRSPFTDDIPLAFLDVKKRDYICGPYGQLIWNFAYYQKYNLHLDLVNSIKKGDIFKKIINGRYNLSLHGANYDMTNGTVQFSYPLEQYETCIVVPLEDELPKFYYIVWPIGRYIWLSLALGSIYVAYLRHLMELPRKHTAFQAIPRNILYSAAILLYCSNMNVNLVNAGVRHMIFYCLLMILAFIISAFHLSHMTAFCMKPVFRESINTVEQLLDEKLTIIVPDKTLDDLRDDPSYANSAYLEKYMYVIGQKNFRPLLKTLDRAYAYMVTEDQWEFMYRQQRYLKKPYFHRSPMCFQKRYQAFPMNLDEDLVKNFQIFQLRAHQAGLWNQWKDEGFLRAVHAGYAYVLSDIYPVLPLDMYFFRFGWVVIIAGNVISCCVMFIEFFIWPHLNCRKYKRIFAYRKPKYEQFG